MSISSIRNPVMRRTALIVFGPFLLLGVVVMGAYDGACDAVSALRVAWDGRE